MRLSAAALWLSKHGYVKECVYELPRYFPLPNPPPPGEGTFPSFPRSRISSFPRCRVGMHQGTGFQD
jgi:hypothetical protein